jgi:hypothetical protein
MDPASVSQYYHYFESPSPPTLKRIILYAGSASYTVSDSFSYYTVLQRSVQNKIYPPSLVFCAYYRPIIYRPTGLRQLYRIRMHWAPYR